MGRLNQANSQAAPPAEQQPGVPVVWLALVAILSVVLYWQTTGIGFLLDDFTYPSIIYRAFHANAEPLIKTMFFGGSPDECALTSFRPGTILSFILDYLLWTGNAFGYHLTNVLCFAANCVLVGLVTLELAKTWNVRFGNIAATAAAALFACYPLHAESTAWIIGRVDVLCTMFYLASIYCYLKHLARPSPFKCFMAFLLFFFSLTCKEMAVSLPLVAAVLVAVRPGEGTVLSKLRAHWHSLAAFFFVLGAFAFCRTKLIGTVVGGYGMFDKHTVRQAFHNFFDGRTWWKVIFGGNDEMALSPAWAFGAVAGTTATVFCAVKALVTRRAPATLLAFLAAWFLIAILPTFQILHIFPNLVGGRLFFLSSAPLCMFIALTFVLMSNADSTNRTGGVYAAPIVAVAAIAVQWAFVLHVDLDPWLEAGRRMSAAKTLIVQEALATAGGDKVLFANLPADYKGSGLISRPQYLADLLKPPITQQDLSNRIDTCERVIPGPSAFASPEQFKDQVGLARKTYIWNEEAAKFLPFNWPSGEDKIYMPFDPGADHNGTRWFTKQLVDPLRLAAVQVTFAQPVRSLGAVYLIWSAPGIPWWQCRINPAYFDDRTITYVPSRLRTWTFAPSISAVGLQGGANGTIVAAHSVSIDEIQPSISIDGNVAKIDAGLIPQCHSITIYVAKSGQAFSDFATNALPDDAIVDYKAELPSVRGQFKLPANLVSGAAVRAVCAQAFDQNHKPVGILSEMVPFKR